MIWSVILPLISPPKDIPQFLHILRTIKSRIHKKFKYNCIIHAFKKATIAKSLQKDLRALIIVTQKHKTLESQNKVWLTNYAASFLLLGFKKRTEILKNRSYEKENGNMILSIWICNVRNPSCSKFWKQMYHRYDLPHDPSA